MRTSLLIGILVIILLIGGLSYYRMVSVSTNSRPAYDALPESTALFFEFKDFAHTAQILDAAEYSHDLAKTGFLVKLRQEATVMDSIMAGTSYTFSGNKALASVYFTELHKFDYLYLIELKNAVNRDIKIALRALQDNKKIKVNEREFKGEPIYEVYWPGLGKPVAFAFMKGVMIYSFSPFLVEESIQHLKESPSIAKEKGFADLLKSAGSNADATVFVRFPKLDQLESLLFNPDTDSLLPMLHTFSGWMAVDLTVKGKPLILNGYTTNGEEEAPYLAQFKGAPNTEMAVAQALPSNTAVFVYKRLTDLPRPATPDDVTEYSYLRPWTGGEMAAGIIEPFDKEFRDQYFLAVACNNEEQANNSLTELARLAVDTAETTDFNGYKITRLHVGKTISNFYDNKLFALTDPYFVVLHNYVLFAANENTLKDVIGSTMNGQTLGKTQSYQSFMANLSGKSNMMLYVDPSKSAEILNALLSPDLLEAIAAGNQGYRKFSPMAIQFTKDGNAFFTSGYINFNGTTDELTNQVWRTQLDTVAIGKPCIIRDPKSGEIQIAVQDAAYNVYLLNKAGKIMWKKNVGNTVKGDFHAVDLYKDGQQQLLFNTTKELYVLDQRGENVGNFPIKLPATATNGLLVIDPDHTHDYKIVVACSNDNIYGYEASGKPLDGWNPQSKTGYITSPLLYVRYNGIDRVLAINTAGTAIYYGLNGKKVFDPIRLGKSFRNPFSLYQTDTTFILVNADKNGLIHILDQNGHLTTQQPDSVGLQSFVYIQNSVAGGNYVLVDSGAIRVYDAQFQKLNEARIPHRIDMAAFAVPVPNDGLGVGLVAAHDNKIYLFGPNMALMEGFPLNGATPFSVELNSNNERILVVGEQTPYVTAYRLK